LDQERASAVECRVTSPPTAKSNSECATCAACLSIRSVGVRILYATIVIFLVTQLVIAPIQERSEVSARVVDAPGIAPSLAPMPIEPQSPVSTVVRVDTRESAAVNHQSKNSRASRTELIAFEKWPPTFEDIVWMQMMSTIGVRGAIAKQKCIVSEWPLRHHRGTPSLRMTRRGGTHNGRLISRRRMMRTTRRTISLGNRSRDAKQRLLLLPHRRRCSRHVPPKTGKITATQRRTKSLSR
jgi:hypothetical protein